MLIESDARRHIAIAIELEQEMSSLEGREKLQGKVVITLPQYHQLREKLVSKLAHINSVANTEGKGRNDFTEDILSEAENVSRRISQTCSKAARRLSEDIKKAFLAMRILLRKYAENIDSVDPQLRNNPELVERLVDFEKSWEKGKEFLLSPTGCKQLIHLSRVVEIIGEKHKEAKEKIDSMDSEAFLLIPCLVMLDSFDGNDQGICAKYFPPILAEGTAECTEYMKAKKGYEKLKAKVKDGDWLYNVFEQTILEKQIEKGELEKHGINIGDVKKIIHEIKILAMGMQRHSPVNWNTFIETALV